ncbi:COX15/CtaA family protein [Thaumasiovibrio subtropicus]|uniref:COX15/CtaA family protein n=1 Tax=Thaumasiovibrio subtropicus TaxID=1891207 RepID=UPI000B358FAF|nr:COX15/CtaA family protein [Thaumasiovibrio subtropicus]
MALYRHWLLIGVLFGVIVVGLGAFTRLTEAGLGCPDWPGCYGFLTVPSSAAQLEQAAARYPEVPVEASKAWYEMIHRYFAGMLGLLVLGLAVVAWRTGKPLLLPLSTLGLVVFQAMLGMWTVTMNLNPFIVMAHLLGGFATVSLLWWQWLRCHEKQQKPPPSRVRNVGFAALFVVIAQIALGAWTSTNYAALVCTQLPLCEADWQTMYDPSAFALVQPPHDTYQYGVLDYGQRVTIHVTHRIGAGVTLLVMLGYLFLLSRQQTSPSVWVIPSVVLAVQIGLGINNVVSILPLANAVAHNVVGLGLLLSVLYTFHPLRLSQSVTALKGGAYGKV